MMKRAEINEEIARELDEEEKRERNKKVLKILAYIFIPLFVIFSVSYILLRYVGNIGIIVREYPIYNSQINDEFNGIKVVQFSDIHYNQYSTKGKIVDIVDLINRTNPDIVIFTGDLVDSNYQISMEEKEFLIYQLNRINSTIGKFAIKGEEDTTIFEEISSNGGFEVLNNKIKPVYKGNDYINIIAVDDNYQLYPSLLEGFDNNKFSIAITHLPDNADKVIEVFNPDIILAGHSHNGQVRLPFIGPMMKRIGSKKYVDSYYKINDTELFISGGLGNVKYNMRLLNHPSINFFRLKVAH